MNTMIDLDPQVGVQLAKYLQKSAHRLRLSQKIEKNHGRIFILRLLVDQCEQ